MQSIATAMRIKRTNDIFRKNISKALESLKRGESIRVTTKVATAILLHHPAINDKSTEVRNVGSGVKELYLKEV